MHLRSVVVVFGIIVAVSLLSATAASAQRGAHGHAGVHGGVFRGGAFHGTAGFRPGGIRFGRHPGAFRGFRGMSVRPGFRGGFVAGVYPWSDPFLEDEFYPLPYPYYFQTVCGYERVPVSVRKKLRWRWIYRCH